MSWQLIAHHDEAVRNFVGKALRKALSHLPVQPGQVEAINIARAKDRIDEFLLDDCALVVVGATMPWDENVGIRQDGREPTQQLIRELKRRKPELPVVVISNVPGDRLAEFLYGFKPFALVTVGPDMGETLVERVRELCAIGSRDGGNHGGSTQRASNARLLLDIHISSERAANWQIRRTGDDAFERVGSLHLNHDLFQRICEDSKTLEREVQDRGDRWESMLTRLSDDLRNLLFYGDSPNKGCWELFLTHRAQVGGLAQTRIRVTVNDQTHPVLVEALKDQVATPADYWALHAPLYRRFDRTTATYPLFKEKSTRDNPINCLVIEADGEPGNLSGSSGKNWSFERLSYCSEEASEIAETLRKAARGVVDHLRLSDVNDDLTEKLLDKLAERQWHIVHFCGHTVGERNEEAALVLRADRDGVVPVKTVIRSLAGTQLLFLSSCRSSSTSTVMHAIEQHVPALLGFQWVINDKEASSFARTFYRLLFDEGNTYNRYLEYAFLEARKAAYRHRPTSPSWVAPVLVMQMG